jgi:2'-5' RNA ligase
VREKAAKTHNTAVVLIPPQEVWPPIQTIRRQHDRHYRRWMPHLTLIYPFRPRSEWAALVELFGEVCSRVCPFELRLSGVGSFRHRSSFTLWLAPEPRDPVVALHTALWRLVPDCDDVRRYGSGYTPHLSVGQARGREDALELIATLQEGWRPCTFQVNEVCLIWRNQPPDDVFRIGERIGLGADRS